MSFNQIVTEQALLACGRHCTLCHKFCGTKIELHHIKPKKDKGEDTLENCLPLCFDCHADVMQYNPSHPKGKKYTESELKLHRKNWYEKIQASTGVPSQSNYLNLDSKTYERILELLRSDKLMLFIKNIGFVCGSFSDEILIQLQMFYHETELPEFEFIDADMEGLKAELVDLFEKLNKLIIDHTFSAGPGFQEIPIEWLDYQQERYMEAENAFIDICPLITEKFESLVKLGRRKFYFD
jgi:hypothetical protein